MKTKHNRSKNEKKNAPARGEAGTTIDSNRRAEQDDNSRTDDMFESQWNRGQGIDTHIKQPRRSYDE